MKRLLCLLFAGFVTSTLLASNALAISYRVTDIASFDSGVGVAGINNHGVLVGEAYGVGAFTWSQGGGVNYLAPLSGYVRSSAGGINDRGQIIGYSEQVSTGYRRASVWQDGGSAVDMGALLSGQSTASEAWAISGNGQAVGYSTSSHGYGVFLWSEDTAMEDITPTSGAMTAYGVNDSSTVVGDRSGRAVIWAREAGIRNISITAPGPPSASLAADINNSGQVLVDYYLTASPWSPPCVWKDGLGAVFLGELSNGALHGHTSGYDLNNLGQVVGESNQIPFIWDQTSGTQALPMLSGHSMGAAQAINDYGLIAGYSYDASGIRHLVLWTPVPEPSSLAALGTGLLPFGAWVMRRRRKA